MKCSMKRLAAPIADAKQTGQTKIVNGSSATELLSGSGYK